jgi:PAS domain S-box-containing protein
VSTLTKLVGELGEFYYRMTLPEGRYVICEGAVDHVLGYSRRDLLTNPLMIEQIIHPESRPYFEQQWSQLLQGVVPPTYQYKVVGHDGEERWVIQSNHLVRDTDDRPIAIEGVCRNVSDQKRMEHAALATEERFRAIMERASDVVILLDKSANVIFATPAVTASLGYRPEEIVGNSAFSYIAREFLDQARSALAEVSTHPGASARISDVKILSADGWYHWFEGILTNLLDNPAVGGLVLNCRQIDARKKAETALLESQERLEERIQERTRQLAEANELLEAERTALRNRTVTLQEVLERFEEGRRELANQIQTNVQKIALPILDLLEQRIGSEQNHYIRLLRSCLEDITSPVASHLSRENPCLTPREQEICHMVRDGWSSKDIAKAFLVSPQTVVKQRKIIRRKLGLKGKRVNLASYLRLIN